jgi:histidine triad (HIT) family protein
MSGSIADCPFCQIIRGQVPAYIVLEDELSLAFLDRRPLFPGHCLLVPKVHYPTLVDLPAELVGPLFGQAQRLAKAVEQGLAVEGTFVAMNNKVSQSVPHLHIHVVPRRKKDGLKGFFWPRQSYENEAAMQEVQQRLRTAMAETESSKGWKD